MRLVFRRVAVGAAALCAMAGANAQTNQVQSFTSMMNGIIRGTPGITNVAISSGVRVSAAASVPVVAGGLTIPVATTVAADVGTATIAAGLGRIALRAVPWVGTAVALAEIADAVKNNGGLVECDNAFFCKPGTSTTTTSQVVGSISYLVGHPDGSSSGTQTTAAATCAAFTKARTATHSSTDGYVYSCTGSTEWDPGKTNPGMSYKWVSKTGSAVGSYTTPVSEMGATITCPNGTTQSYTLAGLCNVTTTTTGEPVPATLDEVNTALAKKANEMHDWTVKMKAEMDAISQANPELETPIQWKGVPITVDAPAVSGPEQVVSTKQIANADGTTSTQTVKTQTTVTPVTSSQGTVDIPGVSYPSKTVTTTTTVNNTTNVTTETTNVTNNAAAAEATEIPTDYAREATLKSILTNLTTEYTGQNPTGDDQLEQVDQQNKNGVAAVSAVTEGSTGLAGWLPTIKTATCRNPQVPNPITGAELDVPICDSVDVFASIISAVIAVFALYGSVREVQAALKA